MLSLEIFSFGVQVEYITETSKRSIRLGTCHHDVADEEANMRY